MAEPGTTRLVLYSDGALSERWVRGRWVDARWVRGRWVDESAASVTHRAVRRCDRANSRPFQPWSQLSTTSDLVKNLRAVRTLRIEHMCDKIES